MSTQPTKQVLAQLRQALFLVNRGWSQRSAARNSLGEPCGPTDKDAKAWSLDAALYFREDYTKGSEVGFEAETYLRESLALKSIPEKKIYQGTVAWNDDPDRTKEEVIRVLTQLILYLSKIPPEADLLDQGFLDRVDDLTRGWTELPSEEIRMVVGRLQELQKGIPPRELVRKHWYLTEGVWDFVQTTKHQMLNSNIYMLGLCAKNWRKKD